MVRLNVLKRTCNYFIIFLLIGLMTVSCALFRKQTNDNPYTCKGGSKILPAPVGYVNDFENILTQEQENCLTEIIKKHEAATTDQIAIVTIASYKPYETLFDYSLDLANYWGVGQKDKNNGIVIVLSKAIKQVRIQNGYGIEKQLTDAETMKIIDDVMIPEFKSNKYFEGINNGLAAIIAALK